MRAELQQAIYQFDGKDVAQLKAVAGRKPLGHNLVSELITLCNSEAGAAPQAASWLLKYTWEKGFVFSAEQSHDLLEILIRADSWPLRLHTLQLFSGLIISEKQQEAVYFHLRYCLGDDNKFVRAWSYNGLAELAKQFPNYLDEVKKLFEMAQKDSNEAASVKARIRNINL
ncbi:hypothetical protein ACVBEJ_07295 [Porticoccus sp. GXU_MW_L64]